MSRITNDEFQRMLQKFRDDGRDIYTDDMYINSKTPLDFYCSKGHHWNTNPCNIMYQYSGCPYCGNRKVLVGFNDLWTTYPHIAKLLKSPERGYLYTAGSAQKDEFECPNCHHTSMKIIHHMTTRGFTCDCCGDRISYPNKFARALLKQLPVCNIHFEWEPDWLSPYSYDNYFEYNNKYYVLEMDGSMGHGNSDKYEYVRKSGMFGKELDDYKDFLASQHNVNVIRIDCAYRDTYKRDVYIKTNILGSSLSKIFDLSSIDWDICNKKAESSIICEVSQLYNNGMSVGEISEHTNYSRTSIKDWLKQGEKISLNNYNVEESRMKGQRKRKDAKSEIKIDQYQIDGTFINHYDSFCSAAKQTGCNASQLSYYNRRGQTSFIYNGFLWKINI